MKKTLALLVTSALLTANVLAANTSKESTGETKKVKSSEYAATEIGYYPGSTAKDELFYWSQKYLPFSRHLTASSGRTVTLVPEQNITVLKNLIKAQKYKWVYVNADVAVLAQEISYTPVLKSARDAESVLVVKPAASLNKFSDLSGKRIGLVKADSISTLARHRLLQSNTATTIVDAPQGHESLLQMLNLGRVDAIVLRKDIAMAAAKNHPTRYRVADSAGTIPNLVLLAHTSVSQDEVERVRAAFTSLRAENPGDQKIMSHSGEHLKDGPFYVSWDRDFLKTARKALAAVEPDYGRYVFDPTRGTFSEAHKIFKETSGAAVKN